MAKKESQLNFAWLWKMAMRDTRKNRGRLFLFISSIILGIAALVAINSFGDNLTEQINGQAKELLGADLALEAAHDTSSFRLELPIIDSAKVAVFASMTTFSSAEGARLTQIRAHEGGYPFYGAMPVTPAEAMDGFEDDLQALVDRTLMMQFDASVGDTVQVGLLRFRIAGTLDGVPGQSGIVSSVAPAVIIPYKYLPATGLIQKGSRVQYTKYFKLEGAFDGDAWQEENREKLRESGFRADTVEERKRDTNRAFENLTEFLGLVAFVALLLGCVGVASSVHIYMREKIPSVAILRCLGASGMQSFMIFLLQIGFMGLIGALLGALLGVAVQQLLPLLLQEFLPVEVDTFISWSSIGFGIVIGLLMAILFALLPIVEVRKASPLLTIRSSATHTDARPDAMHLLVYTGIAAFIYLFSFGQIGDPLGALYFTLALAIAIGIIYLVSKAIMWAVRRFFPVSWGFVWRQSLANLYRPQNQTLVLLATIGLGTALISTVFYVQELLIKQVEITGEEDRPNLLLFDIQNSQLEGVETLMKEFDLPLLQSDPVVNMRLLAINGITRSMAREDSTLEYRTRSFNREYRNSYREELSETESIAEGEWIGRATPGELIPISLEQGFAGSMRVGLGDTLTFDIQGVPMECTIASLRKVEWNRVSSNFVVTFPAGVLENAPQFHIVTTKVPGAAVSAKFQQNLIRTFPTVSVVDLGQILSTVEDVLEKISFVIRFMALFSILTGLIVLGGSVTLSKFQRIKESVLLRTLGSSRKQLLSITLFEYFILGSLSALTGIVLAMVATWLLATFSFDATFQPASTPIIATYFIITGLTVLIGYLNSRSVMDKPPLEVLRAEV